MSQTQKIETYGGFPIFRDPVDGYYWENGPDSDGYFETIEEARESIDSYNASFADDDQVDRADALECALSPHGPWGQP